MANNIEVKELEQVVVRFSGDSGDGMQLAGNIFSTVSATVGNGISTFPDYPADIRAPQGSLTGVSGFQVHIGAGKVYTPGDKCDVLVAMNAAALKTQYKFAKSTACIIIDTDAFQASDLQKAQFTTDNPIEEMGIKQDVIAAPITTIVKEALADSGMDNKSALKCRNMFALGLVCWLFNRELSLVENFLREKFAKKPEIAEANIKVVRAGYDYGANTHSSVDHTYRIESKEKEPGRYMDITGNKATAYGFIAAAEKAGKRLFLGSYPITPATDVLHELAKHKSLGVITVQCEDEISGAASAIGASFAGALAVTSTSGPGVCLKSEAMNLAVTAELPVVLLDVQRGGPSTGLPTKSEQTDLLQALFGRNGESPMPVIAATSPTNCFDAAYTASKIALEHMTPVILLTDAFIANGSSAWKLPNLNDYPAINPPYVTEEMKGNYTPYKRNDQDVRYWAIPGQEGYTHILGGLEKDGNTGAISTDPENHNKMVHLRASKVAKIPVPDVEVEGCKDDADLLIVGFGSTYGHLHSAMDELIKAGKKVALAQFSFINPLPKNTADVLKRYKKVVVAEQNLGQFAAYLRMKVDNFTPYQYNEVKGQPFVISELVEAFNEILNK
ncbi:MAG: 2-oxoacid:acceptor oxidoreductase subunit alpha [Bacteroidales bacterium]|nr:2-oxoacid:acceptor oxidoreductase subunit alpha [Bacteroidaceae bacterium]MBR1940658.1 2-oxoacid:acceptor oxidoreductase subunit alpha [Bacteroidaceae bacterium]MBR2160802.1 2-oxoacid:acceptor oxidoreductase subunit alpha [Bacteroidaceae bacterium]MDO4185780.1 2-oxoacid:acceptor oxidoreductase subunit alpha [Bacteroidales bacterium]